MSLLRPVRQHWDVLERTWSECGRIFCAGDENDDLRPRHEVIGDLPDEVVRRRPVLAIGFVGALMSMNEFETVAGRLDDVEQLLPAIRSRLGSGSAGDIGEAGHDDELVMLDDAELARVPAAVELYRAALALVHGAVPVTVYV